MKELLDVCNRYGVCVYDAAQYSMCPPGYLISHPANQSKWLGYVSLSDSTNPELVESKIVKWLLDSGFG
jgi:hypothetical protein